MLGTEVFALCQVIIRILFYLTKWNRNSSLCDTKILGLFVEKSIVHSQTEENRYLSCFYEVFEERKYSSQ